MYNYNYTHLLNQIPEVLNSVLITTVCKFTHKLWRYIDVYNKGLESRVAEWAVSKFKSHRRLPENIERIIEIEYREANMGKEENE
jgi:hypothetical protein